MTFKEAMDALLFDISDFASRIGAHKGDAVDLVRRAYQGSGAPPNSWEETAIVLAIERHQQLAELIKALRPRT